MIGTGTSLVAWLALAAASVTVSCNQWTDACSDTMQFRNGQLDDDVNGVIEMVPPHFSISELRLHTNLEAAGAKTRVTTKKPRTSKRPPSARSTAASSSLHKSDGDLTPVESTSTAFTFTSTELDSTVSEGSTTVALEDSTTGVEVEGPYEEAGDYTDSATQYDETANEQCEFEILCDAQSRFVTLDTTQFTTGSNATLRLPVLAPPGRRGPPGTGGDKGNRGAPGPAGLDGLFASELPKVAFFAGLMSNFGPISRPEDVKFGAVVTNYGFGYNDNSGRFVAPFDGTYMFHVTIAAQGEQRAAVRLLLKTHDSHENRVLFTLWCESIPYWSSTSNNAIVRLRENEQVWVRAMSIASAIHGYMYSTFSGHIICTD